MSGASPLSIRRASVNEAAEQRIKVTSVLTKFRQHPGALVNHPDYTGGARVGWISDSAIRQSALRCLDANAYAPYASYEKLK